MVRARAVCSQLKPVADTWLSVAAPVLAGRGLVHEEPLRDDPTDWPTLVRWFVPMADPDHRAVLALAVCALTDGPASLFSLDWLLSTGEVDAVSGETLIHDLEGLATLHSWNGANPLPLDDLEESLMAVEPESVVPWVVRVLASTSFPASSALTD